ncbi:hypothetical protein V2J09_007959 [Rumex salicifolius]
MYLRLQDFKNVSDYNSEMFRIVSTLRLCGEIINDIDMLEKTFSTFHATNLRTISYFSTITKLALLGQHHFQTSPKHNLKQMLPPIVEDMGGAQVVVVIVVMVMVEWDKDAIIHRSTQMSRRIREISPRSKISKTSKLLKAKLFATDVGELDIDLAHVVHNTCHGIISRILKK